MAPGITTTKITKITIMTVRAGATDMPVVRTNILTDDGARADFVDGVLALKHEFPGVTMGQVGVPGGGATPISTYDLFVVWHCLTMNAMTPPGNPDGRNAAHGGPVFCPWHRFLLALFEASIQRVLSKPSFALPYWDWAADGELPIGDQQQSQLWQPGVLGGSGNPVASGPFAFGPGDETFRVRVDQAPTMSLRPVNRGLRRQLGESGTTLASGADVHAVLDRTDYDTAPWSSRSTGSFRNGLEGWDPTWASRLHNGVHVWVGGDMGSGTSPNDPVFYLNHCNVDRIWEAWLTATATAAGRAYVPDQSAPADLRPHRLDDPLRSLFTKDAPTPRQVLDMGTIYGYDALPA
jgi:tyrosinase